jgi:hypothetical protein
MLKQRPDADSAICSSILSGSHLAHVAIGKFSATKWRIASLIGDALWFELSRFAMEFELAPQPGSERATKNLG